MRQEIICIRCPLGCSLMADINEEGIHVRGNQCRRGEEYAKKELTNPTRMVTSTVIVKGGTMERLSVKTESDIPKNKIYECMEEINKVVVKAPIYIGDIILTNVCDTGVDIIATKEIEICE